MSNFFEMGLSYIQPAWESNNNNKKWRRGIGFSTAARVRGVQARGGGTAAASGSLGWLGPEGEGERRGRSSRYLCGPRPGADPRAKSGGSFRSFSGTPSREPGGSALAAQCYSRIPWGSRHVFFNSRHKGERGRRGAGQVNAGRGFRGCRGPRSSLGEATVGRESALGLPKN